MNLNWISTSVAALAIGVAGFHSPMARSLHHGQAGQIAAKQHAMMALGSALDLSPAQAKNLHETLQGYQANREKAKGDSAALAAIRAKAEAKVRTILTADQMSRLESGGGLGLLLGDFFDHVHTVFAELELSPQQASQMHTIILGAFNEMVQGIGDRRLSPSDRQAKMASLHQTMFAKAQALLNPAQREKLHILMQNQHGG